jgi:Mrp family chromosome partitioning ATPase
VTAADSPDRANLDSQRATTVSQINTLAGRMNQLATMTVSAGKIITDASLPRRAVKPNVPLDLASGAMAGVLLGVLLSLLRERLDRRVGRPAELSRRVDIPVLATLPTRAQPRLDEILPPFGAGGRIFNRLRNEILASLPVPAAIGGVSPGRVVVVTGASRGPAATVVAANLAAAFSRTGSETVMVAAHLPDTLVDAVPVTRLLDVMAVPGLSDVLAGRVDLDRGMQRAPGNPWLRVIATGGTASAGGLLQSQALRDMLATLRQRAEYVVIDAPSTSSSADAQTLAGLADAALLVAEQRRTRFVEVADAADQIRRVGTPVLGAVLIPRVTRRAEPTIQPGTARPALPAVSTVATVATVSTVAGSAGRQAVRPPTPASRPGPAGEPTSTVDGAR